MVPFEPEVVPISPVRQYTWRLAAPTRSCPENTERLAGLLRNAGANVTLDWQPGGHGIGRAEVEAARRWLAQEVAW